MRRSPGVPFASGGNRFGAQRAVGHSGEARRGSVRLRWTKRRAETESTVSAE